MMARVGSVFKVLLLLGVFAARQTASFGPPRALHGPPRGAAGAPAAAAGRTRRRFVGGPRRAVSGTVEEARALARVVVSYCPGCRWLLRSAWLAQELLMTFETTDGPTIGEVTLRPAYDAAGTFTVTVDGAVIWDRMIDGGFPEAKVLKQRVRDVVDPRKDLGHSEGAKKTAADWEADEERDGRDRRRAAFAASERGPTPASEAIRELARLMAIGRDATVREIEAADPNDPWTDLKSSSSSSE